MVNNGETKLNPEYTLDNEYIICTKCKFKYTPIHTDITIKNPNLYYKQCKKCREYNNNARKKHFEKNLKQ